MRRLLCSIAALVMVLPAATALASTPASAAVAQARPIPQYQASWDWWGEFHAKFDRNETVGIAAGSGLAAVVCSQIGVFGLGCDVYAPLIGATATYAAGTGQCLELDWYPWSAWVVVPRVYYDSDCEPPPPGNGGGGSW